MLAACTRREERENNWNDSVPNAQKMRPQPLKGEAMQKVTVIYDGECPFCQRFVAWQKLRDNYAIELINARQCDNIQALAQGRDLNEGMLVIYNGHHHFGADAI